MRDLDYDARMWWEYMLLHKTNEITIKDPAYYVSFTTYEHSRREKKSHNSTRIFHLYSDPQERQSPATEVLDHKIQTISDSTILACVALLRMSEAKDPLLRSRQLPGSPRRF